MAWAGRAAVAPKRKGGATRAVTRPSGARRGRPGLRRPSTEAGSGAQGDGTRLLEETTPPPGFREGHCGQQNDLTAADRLFQARDVGRAQAHAPQCGAEPPEITDRAGGDFPGEHAPGHDPTDTRQPENGARGDGPENRPPGLTGEDRDTARVEPAVQEGPRRRLGPVRRVEQRDEQDLGRVFEGAHDGLTATKK